MWNNLVFRLDVSLMGTGRLRAVSYFSFESQYRSRARVRGDSGKNPYNELFREAQPEGGTFFRLQVYKRVGIPRAEVDKKVRNLIFGV